MTKEPGDKAMFVERLLPTAREKLVTIADDAPLVEVAKLLRTGTGLVVVCGSSGLLARVERDLAGLKRGIDRLGSFPLPWRLEHAVYTQHTLREHPSEIRRAAQ
jgi:hypothetical protein